MAHGQTLPPAAETYHRTQQVETLAASAAASRQWLRMDPRDIDRSWASVGPMLLTILATGQRRVAGRAPSYMSSVLRQTGQARWDAPFADTLPFSLVGVAGDGRPVGTLLELAPIEMKTLIRDGMTGEQALDRVNTWVQEVTETVVADTARAAEKVEMAVREIGWYARIVNAGACSRCAILAGRQYRMAEAFERHERCRCEHIPVGQSSEFNEWQLDPDDYFNSLPSAAELDAQYPHLTVQMRREAGLRSQEDVFTKAGAEAIRAGADMNQVVNARRGMSTAQINPNRGWTPTGRLSPTTVFGREMFITTEGTTHYGSASRFLRRRSGGQAARLMPETIVSWADGNVNELRRLLRAHGYIR